MEENKDMRTKINDLAIENFKNGLNCAECVYDALVRGGALDVDPKTIAMCIGFGGGIGLTGHTCGALSAAVMANGAKYGRPDPWSVDKETRGTEIAEKYYRRYNKLTRDFIDAHHGESCREICAPFGDWHSKERRVNCMKLIGATAALAYDYLQMPQEEAFALPYGPGNMGGME